MGLPFFFDDGPDRSKVIHMPCIPTIYLIGKFILLILFCEYDKIQLTSKVNKVKH